MSLDPLLQAIGDSRPARDFVRWLRHRPATRLSAIQAPGSLPAFLLAHAHQTTNLPFLVVASEEEEGSYFYSDLHQLLQGDEARLLHFPSESLVFYDSELVADPSKSIQRADALQQLKEGFSGIVVTDARALFDRVVSPDSVQSSTLVLRLHDELPPETLAERLVDQGFVSVDFVQEPGEIARRGGIVDVYPFTGDYPIRIEYFGDTVDSLREFDPSSQRSVSRLDMARLVPNFDTPDHPGSRESTLVDFLPDETVVILLGGRQIFPAIDRLLADATAAYERSQQRLADARPRNRSVFDEPEPAPPLPPDLRYLSGQQVAALLEPFAIVSFRGTHEALPDSEKASTVEVGGHPQPPFHASIKLLRARLAELARERVTVSILCDNRGQQSALFDLLELDDDRQDIYLRLETIHEGFELPDAGIAVYTDHQIFNRYHRPSTRKRKKRGGISLRELRDLSHGDFVVHVDHGVGRFDGLEKIEVRGKRQEVVRVLYEGGDVLYVNVSALHKLHKFTSQEGHQPRLTRLGSGQWERTKSKAKRQVKEMARDLIKLYAERKSAQGFSFSPDTVWQRELEAGFEYEDTPDQATASADTKSDMEQPVPMDRLVCGDVGFGKTEIAVRASFKAVQDGKQVAVLVPTTILADQHFETFRRRLGAYPVQVDMLSRFRSGPEQKQTVKQLAEGKVDILIGTHRTVSKDVRFKDLGLLIIDEEQRFGVQVKERLRKIRPNVDTLTLTATPIPRTLQFSLMGARDLSIISTPPPNRRPIVTEIHTYDKDLIRDAILHEVSRGGQVFFIHNRIKSIEEIAFMLRDLVANVRFQVGHGQMKSSDLERVMHGFVKHEFDVLISTNIVESGLDVPNANTMIINQAELFGLADLHQLRGRVGRSDRRAFCYLLTNSIRSLSREARQRLQAVEEYSDLGAGLSIAMRDLDIRGAGNLLGTSQSGFIAEVGFETFHRILDQVVHELRTEEFAHVFGESVTPPVLTDTVIDIEEDAFIPEDYVSYRLERLSLYRRISEATDPAALAELKDEMVDRFGPLSSPVANLLAAAEIKLVLLPLRLPRIQFKNERLFLEMPSAEDDFFYRHHFQPLLKRLATLGRRYVLKDTNKKLRVIVQEVRDLDVARSVALHIAPS